MIRLSIFASNVLDNEIINNTFLTYTLALQTVNFPEGSTLLACDAVSLGQ